MSDDVMGDTILLEIPIKIDGFVEDILVLRLRVDQIIGLKRLKLIIQMGLSQRVFLSLRGRQNALNKGGSVIIFIRDTDGDVVTLTKQKFIDGITWASGSKYIEILNENGYNYIDAGNIDADESDCILQYATFGEIILGDADELRH